MEIERQSQEWHSKKMRQNSLYWGLRQARRSGISIPKLADANLNVDMIVQATEQDGSNNITFTVDKDDLNKTEEVLGAIADEIGAAGIKSQSDICKVSIVGVGMVSRAGVAAKMFTELGKANINIHLITTSEIKVSCAIDSQDGEKAVKVLHEAMDLA